MRLGKNKIIQIIVAIIGAMGFIIGTWLMIRANQSTKTFIYLINTETRENIPGEVYIDGDKNPTTIDPEIDTSITLKRGSHTIYARSAGYHPKEITFDRGQNPISINMDQIAVITTGPAPLSLVGWNVWNGLKLTEGAIDNEITVNGTFEDAAGFNSITVNTVLRGKTLILYFSNTQASNFSLKRMVKLTYNRGDILLYPTNVSFLHGEYLPEEDTPPDKGIEFVIPDDFDGKLGFVFYDAVITDLKITAYYK